ncbi:threonine synthase [Flavisolibacter nicotianae]|uniref:threonine synthase n=1 Tax=Flavisolibacter nicotianae TaxID=2364882 RepID=UPI000EAC2D8B|nr:threonine synthase [Flavisolibacter nicotianae]
MKYYSTNNKSLRASFSEAAIQGQAPDKGLYFPETIPQLPSGFLDSIDTLSKEELAFTVMKPYVGDSISDTDLQTIVSETINFPFPLVPVTPAISTLELFHGPTLAFKDVGARFMSRCLGHFVKNRDKEVTVLVATSGDTGGAVANGFYGVEGVNVVILYPSGKVSRTQEVQLTTLGKNITAIEVDGTFDDCQQMVKNAFMDEELKKSLFLTSANSINVARWLPQQLYYFFAYQQWKDKGNPPVISVPSGNFGNICAGLLAYCSGLPAQHFVAACNANDTVLQFLESGTYTAKASVSTLSNAMDVGNPSNFVRIMELFGNQLPSLKNILTAYSISDDETKTVIKDVQEKYHYLLDPHGAVGFIALQRYLSSHDGAKGYFLETAHPVKFYDVIEPVTGQTIPVPESIAVLLDQPKKSIRMKPDDEALKVLLLEGSLQLHR